MYGQTRRKQANGVSWALATVILPSLGLFFLWASAAPAAGDKSSVPACSARLVEDSRAEGAASAVFRALLTDLFPDRSCRKVREIALAAIGATRGLDPDAEITLPGAIGTAPQAVDISRPLLLRWNGGAPPFQIELAEASIGQRVVKTSVRNARLDLSGDPWGAAYTLTIEGKNDVRLSLPLSLVAPADVPLAPGIDAAQDPEARELVEAVWLLSRAPITWRLEALSRLELLAKDKNNVVARAILEPVPPPDGDKDQ